MIQLKVDMKTILCLLLTVMGFLSSNNCPEKNEISASNGSLVENGCSREKYDHYKKEWSELEEKYRLYIWNSTSREITVYYEVIVKGKTITGKVELMGGQRRTVSLDAKDFDIVSVTAEYTFPEID